MVKIKWGGADTDMNKMVSVVIPVYKYLDKIVRCLDSLSAQTFTNFEVILVCHPNTHEEIERIARKYRFETKVLSTGKDGVSACRNIGINHSKSEYIVFLDSDDYVLERYLEVLVRNMRDNVCLAMCNYMQKFEDESVIQSFKMKDRVYSPQELLENMYGPVEQYNGFIWNKIFRRKIINDNKIRFDEEVSLNEDRLFIVTYLLSVDSNSKIVYSAKTLYQYIMHKYSVTARLRRGELPRQKAMSEIVSFSKCEKMLEDNEKVINRLVRESVERSIIILRLLTKNSAESRRIEGYINRMRHKYKDLFTKKRRLQMFLYEHYVLRSIWIDIGRRTY